MLSKSKSLSAVALIVLTATLAVGASSSAGASTRHTGNKLVGAIGPGSVPGTIGTGIGSSGPTTTDYMAANPLPYEPNVRPGEVPFSIGSFVMPKKGR